MLMRRLIIIPLLLFYINVLCQEYHPFNFENGNWVFEWFSYGESPNGPYNGFTQYWSYGDTLINDSIYFKFYKYTIRHNNYGPTDTIFNYCGAIRQTNAKQIVYVKPDVDTACIIYDFNLSVGDTIRYFPPDTWLPYDELIVISVDSVLICGRYHKSFTLNDTMMIGQTVLIEGIGFNSGLLRPIFDQFEHTNHLDCYTEPNNTNCESCHLLMNQSRILFESDINTIIYPNPFSDYFRISSNKKIKSIEIFNSNGQLHDIIKIGGCQSCLISAQNLNNKIYFVLIRFSNNEITVRRIIKK